MMNDIKKYEWDKIVDLSIEFAYPESSEQENLTRLKLLKELLLLQDKYGKNVDILATQAQYTLDMKAKERLFNEAFELAVLNHDIKNEVMITSSLADLYFDLEDKNHFTKWVQKLKEVLVIYPDPDEIEHYNYLMEELSKHQNH